MLNRIKKKIFNDNNSLKMRIVQAALWSLAGSGGTGLIRFSSNLILTRLLYPEAFGLMAAAMVVLTLVQIFSDTGIKTALIQNPHGERPEYVNTSFIIALVRSMVLFLIIAAAIEPAACFYGKPQLKTLMWIMSFSMLIEGLINPALPLVIKRMHVEKQVIYSVGSQFAGFICTIFLTYLLRSVTALAIGYLLTSVFRVITSYLVVNYRPKLEWNREAGRELIRFGKYIMVNTMITWSVMNIDRLIIGKILDMEMLGYYNIALYIGYYITQILVQIFAQSYFPAMSLVAGNRQKVIRIYRKTTTMAISVITPILVIVALFSSDIITLLYDPRYQLASLALFWISWKSVVDIISTIQSGTMLALGKPAYVTISMAVGLLFLGAAMPLMTIEFGLMGTGVSLLTGGVIISLTQSFFLIKKMGFSRKIVLKPWMHTLVLCLVLVLIYLTIKQPLQNAGWYNIPLITVMGLFSMSAALGVYLVFNKSHRLIFQLRKAFMS